MSIPAAQFRRSGARGERGNPAETAQRATGRAGGW
jgi:hypothetical protein